MVCAVAMIVIPASIAFLIFGSQLCSELFAGVCPSPVVSITKPLYPCWR